MSESNELAKTLARTILGNAVGCCQQAGYTREQTLQMVKLVYATVETAQAQIESGMSMESAFAHILDNPGEPERGGN